MAGCHMQGHVPAALDMDSIALCMADCSCLPMMFLSRKSHEGVTALRLLVVLGIIGVWGSSCQDSYAVA